jgi:hypothetical protein
MRPLLFALALLSSSIAASEACAEASRPLDLRIAPPSPTPLPSRFAERAAGNAYFRFLTCLAEADEYAPPTPTIVVTRPTRRGERETQRIELKRDDATLTRHAQICARAFR